MAFVSVSKCRSSGDAATLGPNTKTTREKEGTPVDVRIGVIHSLREIEIELADDADRDSIRKQVDEALADESHILWFADRFGREVAIPAAKVAYVELGRDDTERRIGFGS
jgi:hypothetical protein